MKPFGAERQAKHDRNACFSHGREKRWSAILYEKFDLISCLLEVFSHETSQRWPMLDDEALETLGNIRYTARSSLF